MASSEKVYKVIWPKAEDHRTRSLSGVLVGTNVQGQVALHFYNEVRELEEEVEYGEGGVRLSASHDLTYVRELTDSILISEASARRLSEVLNTLFSDEAPGEVH